MRRRTVLASLPSLLVAGTAGCLSGAPGGTGTTTTPDRPTLTDTEFRVTDRSCGSGTDEATVSFDAGARVTVSGTIAASNLCQGARLGSADYDADADELTLRVETHTIGDGCAQCLAELSYRGTAVFEGGLPGSVVVEHDSMGGTHVVARVQP